MTGNVTLVTGGNRGIGRATCLALAARGSDIVLTYCHHADEAADLVDVIEAMGRRARALRLDLLDIPDLDRFAGALGSTLQDHFGCDRLDRLVLNAGTGIFSFFDAVTEDELDTLLTINVKAPFLLMQLLEGLIADGGRVVTLGAALTQHYVLGATAFATSKGAMETLSRHLGYRLGRRGIAVNCVAPGAIATAFANGHFLDDPLVHEAIAGGTLFGRIGRPEDVAGAVVALLEPQAGWITCQRVEVMGGFRP